MLNLKRNLLILVITVNYCASDKTDKIKDQDVLPSEYIYNPSRIYDNPYSRKLDSYIYLPTDSHYEVVHYHTSQEPKYNAKIVSPIIYEISSPRPFKRTKPEHSKSEKIIVNPEDTGSSYKKYEVNELSNPKSSQTIVKKGNGEVSKLSEGGKKFEESYHKKHGYKTSEGYDSKKKFSKGNKDSYEKKQNSKEENSEKKKSMTDYEDLEKSEEDNVQGHKEHGEKYNLKKHHKKGSKAKGYHNVFMKDEYKKDHIFYDNADEKGHYSKHGSDHTKYHNDDYELKKGSHNNADNESDSKIKQSLTDKKNYDVADENYEKETNHKFKDGESQEYKFESGNSGYNLAITHSV